LIRVVTRSVTWLGLLGAERSVERIELILLVPVFLPARWRPFRAVVSAHGIAEEAGVGFYFLDEWYKLQIVVHHHR
jgi:hypothetical protein